MLPHHPTVQTAPPRRAAATCVGCCNHGCNLQTNLARNGRFILVEPEGYRKVKGHTTIVPCFNHVRYQWLHVGSGSARTWAVKKMRVAVGVAAQPVVRMVTSTPWQHGRTAVHHNVQLPVKVVLPIFRSSVYQLYLLAVRAMFFLKKQIMAT